MPIEYLSLDRLRGHANQFQQSYNLPKTLPVPIERIAEAAFGIDIIPIPGLQQNFEIVGYISRDLKEIRVDEFVCMHRVPRFRFTIAHELSHAILHRELFTSAGFSSIDEWKSFLADGISEADYRRMEWQANRLAGLILVPEGQLKPRFNTQMKHIINAGIDIVSEREVALESIAIELAHEKHFYTSSQTMEIRIDNDGLFDLFGVG